MKSVSFFTPTLLKLIIASLLFVFFVPFISYDTGIRCVQAPCPSLTNIPIATWMLINPSFSNQSFSTIKFILGWLSSYLVACFFIWIIKKIKKVRD